MARAAYTLFYLAGDKFMAVDVAVGSAQFDSGTVHALFDVRVPAPVLGTRSTYAVAPDGSERLMMELLMTRAPTKVD